MNNNNSSKKKHSLGVNAALNGLQSILNLIFPLITFPYVSRILSVEGMGIYNFSSTYVGYFLLIAGLGINTYAIREGAKFRDNYRKMSNFSSEVFSLNMTSTLVAYILLILSLLVFKVLNNYSLCILIFSIQILFTTLGTNWLYVIYEDYAYITTRNIVFKIISIILLFVFVKKTTDYLIYAWITVLASVGSNLLNYIHAKSFVKLRFSWKTNWRIHVKPTLIIFASAIAVNIYVSSDNTILGLIKGDREVGIYGVSVKIYTIVASLLTAILTVTIPRLSVLYGKKLFNEYKVILNKLINLLIVLTFPAMTGLMMLSKNIVVIIAGEKYIQASNSLAIIAWAILFSLFSWVISDCVLLPAKREKYLLKSTIITAIFNVMINLVFIPLWSYDGASLSTVLAEVMSVTMNAYYGKDILKKTLTKKTFVKNVLDALIGCVVVLLFCYMVNLNVKSFVVGILISVPLAIIGYFITLVLCNNLTVKEAVEYMRNTFQEKRQF
ncbi:flippase [Limosilactobacillus sp.]|jgi:O-antigen/teichoic acid export membrane protein|uniref:flippase n=1 Tax=Limosilactobacillus sp. TaxID=2773925 RepID=UPI0025C2E385|nr:flippase [Limosilactobacillus sp.]MCH3922278.1 flippase [Limosilactobacillus sp.]MCH3929050.1 flippase [Limosilactobacillus sp.]